METASQGLPPLLLTVGLNDATEEAGEGRGGEGQESNNR